VEANRESSTGCKEFPLGLKSRGLRGIIFTVSDDHPDLKRAIAEVLAEAYWQRWYVHFLRDALDYLAHKIADDCLIELRWLYAEEARRDLAAWLLRWHEKYPRLCAWVEENIEENSDLPPAASRTPQTPQKHPIC
jgi:putative transposase